MSDIPIPERDIGEIIMIAINEVGRSEGASLDDIERYLTSTQNDVPDLERIQSILNSAVANGSLLKLDNGKYKINGSLEEAEAASENVNTDEKFLSVLLRGDLNKAQDMISKRTKEGVQAVERAFGKVDPDKNRTADPNMENVDRSEAEKEDANVAQDHGKNKTSDKDADYRCLSCWAKRKFAEKEENSIKVTQDATNEAGPEKEQTPVKVTQDATNEAGPEKEQNRVKVAQDTNGKADSNVKNDSSVAEQKDANVPLPDDDDTTDIEKKMRDVMKDK